jgi:hypothetical protein
MTVSTHFIHKFKNSTIFLLISHVELVKEVLFENGGIVLIHCEMRAEESYMFTLCMEYKISFHLPIFLKSLENFDYESLMREVEE